MKISCHLQKHSFKLNFGSNGDIFSPMPGVFVTGTGTGIGKTIISAGIAYYLRSKGLDVGVMKPFATGAKRYSRKYSSEDVAFLSLAAKSEDSEKLMNPYFFQVAASPYVAAKLLRRKPASLDVALRAARKLEGRHEFLVVEGIGGLLVPISANTTVADFASKLGLPVIIVTLPVLGTLNHTLLTVQACKKYRLDINAIIINQMPRNADPVTRQSPQAIKDITGVSYVGIVEAFNHPSPRSISGALETLDIDRILSVK